MTDEITLKIVLDHIAAMEQRLSGRFLAVENRLLARVEDAVTGLAGRMGRVDEKLQAAATSLSQ